LRKLVRTEFVRVLIGFAFILLLGPSLLLPQTGKAATVAELATYNKPDREKVLYEGAKKEGKVLWYTSLTGGPNLEVPKAFEVKYPGIKADVYRGDSDALISRVLQEAQAKRYLVDSIETTFPILKVMQDYKLLATYFSPYLAQYPDEVKERAEKGLVYWATDRESYIGLAYNTNVIPPSAAPKKFADLLRPELKDKIGFATSDTGSRVIGAMLATKGAEFVQKLKSQEVTLHAVSGRAILDMVISGEGEHLPRFFSATRAYRSRKARRSNGCRWMSCPPMRAEWLSRPTRPTRMLLCFSVIIFSAPKGRSSSANSDSTAPSTSPTSSAGTPSRA